MTVLAEAIHHVRLSAGMSQTDLASRTGLTQATLSRYENGLREPDTGTLRILATELGVTDGLLTSLPAFHGAVALRAHMRRRGTAKATRWRMLEARLNMLRIHVHRLVDVADLRFNKVVPRINPSDLSAAEAARRVRIRWSMPLGPVESMLGSMEAAGCFIAKVDFGSPRVAALSQWVGEFPVVMLNAHAPVDEVRMTLAHELGHLVLHSEPEFVSTDFEREGAAFAAAFLMPEYDVESDLVDVSLTALHDLKIEWRVSMQTLMERAHGLGAIDDRRRTSIYKMLSRRGWLATEPLGDVLPPEQPRLLRRVLAALEASGYSEDEVATIGGFSDIASASGIVPLGRP
jgi:Zn-dependent peptidase ImmA (M78 family)/transcriptional regulator with XRE-family HTH domain